MEATEAPNKPEENGSVQTSSSDRPRCIPKVRARQAFPARVPLTGRLKRDSEMRSLARGASPHDQASSWRILPGTVADIVMQTPLTIAAAQPASVARDVAANAAAHALAIRAAASRVVVFPELSLTGYELDAEPITIDDPRLTPIVDACGAVGALALVGAPVRDRPGGAAYIATLAVDTDGVRVAYRKVNVAVDEGAWFAPGPHPAAIEVDGWRLGLAICKDTEVARHVEDTVALGIDAYVAGTVMFDHEAAGQDARATRTAQAHGIWVVISSFAGPTGAGYDSTAGRSGIWSPAGEVVGQVGPEIGAIARAKLV